MTRTRVPSTDVLQNSRKEGRANRRNDSLRQNRYPCFHANFPALYLKDCNLWAIKFDAFLYRLCSVTKHGAIITLTDAPYFNSIEGAISYAKSYFHIEPKVY